MPPNYDVLNRRDKRRAKSLLRKFERQLSKLTQRDFFRFGLPDQDYLACVEAVVDATDSILEQNPTRLGMNLIKIGTLAAASDVSEISEFAKLLEVTADQVFFGRAE